MIRLTTLENRFETDLIVQILEEEGIDYVVKPFQDTAYDGLFVTQKGYALLLVREEDRYRAQGVVDDVRAAAESDDAPLDDEDVTD